MDGEWRRRGYKMSRTLSIFVYKTRSVLWGLISHVHPDTTRVMAEGLVCGLICVFKSYLQVQ